MNGTSGTSPGDHRHRVPGRGNGGQVSGDVLLVLGTLAGLQQHEAGLPVQAPLERQQRGGVPGPCLAEPSCHAPQHQSGLYAHIKMG
jgi:hypothetical protein